MSDINYLEHILISKSNDDPVMPDVKAPMIPDGDDPATSGDATPGSGWHLNSSLEISIMQFSS